MRPETNLLILAALILITIAALRPPEYDEAYSIFLTAGDPRPAWPTTPFHPAQIRSFYTGSASFPQIAENLRTGDVHPPLYFWLLDIWRAAFGPSWFAARLLSVACAIATLATLAHLARLLKIPPIPALLLCLLTYGFAYTAIIARNFSLANLLLLTGITCIFRHSTTPYIRDSREGGTQHMRATTPAPTLLLAGLSLGAATFTNDLTLFTALTALAYLTLKTPSRAPLAILPFTAFLPFDAYFFIRQHATRPHQFPPLSLPNPPLLQATDSPAPWFRGLPLYAGQYAILVALGLGLLALTTLTYIAKTNPPHTAALAALTISTQAGLLALGVIFRTTPIEIRYLAFSLPYLALLIAAGTPRTLQILLGLTQSAAIAGLAVSPLTAQPQSAAAGAAAALATPTTLTLLPFGNDGVGIPGPFLAAAPDSLTILLLHPNTKPNLTRQTRVLLITLTRDSDSRTAISQTETLLATTPCWHLQSTPPLARLYKNTCPHMDSQ